MDSKPLTPKQFATKLVEFTSALQAAQHEKKLQITEEERIVDLFRLWLIDTRDQEMLAEVREDEEARKDRGFD